MPIAYIVKRYPRYSETFIVNEILAHESAGQQIVIYALLPPQDSHFQDTISRVRAPVTYLSAKADRASQFWELQKKVAQRFSNVWQVLGEFPKASAREILQSLELSEHVGKEEITHLHAHFATTSTTVAQITSAITGVPFTFTAHAKDIFHQDVDREQLARKFQDAHCAVTVSDFNVNFLTEQIGVPKRNLTRIYNGLDLSQFLYVSPEVREPIICAVGRLVEKKGFEVLIEACQILKHQAVRFQCHIIGSGDLYQRLEEKIEALGLIDCVSMLGALPQREVKQKLHQSSVFAAPCIVGRDGNRDGMPTVLLEAMAMGTPCISTDVTGIPEVLEHQKTGLMVEQNSPNDLAKALKRLLLDGRLRREIAQRARHKIEQEFDVDKSAQRLRDCFALVDSSLPSSAVGK
ncbi:glycosyltransferase [Vibrio sonorensis]|uniref:glycosyltransferase n=1 Tax=Vibrio sonorensis TaxID=1004316 RepID=UPI0008D952E9|nr:glycosyltransferase [Vibrio sonorensis]